MSPPKERVRKGTGSRTGDSWRVIVLNDNHNTFEGVAFALAQTIPGVDYDKGIQLATKIHTTGQAIVFSGLTPDKMPSAMCLVSLNKNSRAGSRPPPILGTSR